MKKGIGIIVMLAIVMILASVGVFYVESITTPIIDQRKAEEIEAALENVYPAIVGSGFTTQVSDKDLSGTLITEALEVVDGSTVQAVVYTVVYRGYTSEITSLVSVDNSGVITGYQTISQGDTKDLGAEIANPDNWTQFTGMGLETASLGAFDGLAGATITTVAWQGAFASVFDFHKENYPIPLFQQSTLNAVYPALADSDYTVNDTTLVDEASGITAITEIKDGDSVMATIYKVTFYGYQSDITYAIGVDSAGKVTGYVTLAQGDTPDLGAKIADEENWEQFTGLYFPKLNDGVFDGLAGATVTTDAWAESFVKLYAYHDANYTVPALTDQELLEIDILDFVGSGNTITELTVSNEFRTLEDYSIEYAYIVNDGSADTHVVYYDVFWGAFGDVETLISISLADDTVSGFKALSSEDTPGWGQAILEQEKWDQVSGLDQDGLRDGSIDGIAGSTLTTVSWKDSLLRTYLFHQAEFKGQVQKTPQEIFEDQKAELFPSADEFVDVTSLKPYNVNINNIYDVQNSSDESIGTLYYVTTLGPSTSGLVTIDYLLAIDADNTFTGLTVTSSDVTLEDMANFLDGTYDYGLDGTSVNGEFTLAANAGTDSVVAVLQDMTEQIVTYHMEKYFELFEADQADLELALPGATVFTSIYGDYDFVAGIDNIYEAKDAGDTVVGYVYVGSYAGYGGTVRFAIGIGTDDRSEAIEIISNSESWNNATFAGYDGSAGLNFPASPWLDNFDDLLITDDITTTVDSISGVSTTSGGEATFGLIEAVDLIFNYHTDNSVGGAS